MSVSSSFLRKQESSPATRGMDPESKPAPDRDPGSGVTPRDAGWFQSIGQKFG
jgi:hypothetical protein